MRKINLIIIAFIICSCDKKEGLELELVTKEINCLKVNKTEMRSLRNSEEIPPKEALTIIRYKLTNYSDTTYYFNHYDLNLQKKSDVYVPIDNAFLQFFDENNNPVISKQRQTDERVDYKSLEILKYRYFVSNSLNFIIHPQETLYFEWYVVLPFGTLNEKKNSTLFFNYSKKYFASLYLGSEGKSYKKMIPRDDLETIKINGYHVYNGIIKSKNRVPVVFRDNLNKN